MKFVKSSIALILASTLTAPVMADELNFYGRANVSAQMSDDGDGSFTEVRSNDDSRAGVSGGLKINDGIEVIFKMELSVDMDGDGEDNLNARNQYVGLAGTYGTVMLGKRDTAMKDTSNKQDLFNDHEGDFKILWEGENRESDSVTYYSPSFNHLRVGVTYVAEGDKGGTDGISTSVVYGDKGLKKSELYAFAAVDSDVDGHDVIRVGGAMKLNELKLYATVQSQEEVATGEEMEGVHLGAAYKLNQFVLRGQIQTADYDDKGEQFGVGLGVDYFLAKNARLYVNYNTFDMDTENDREYFATGIAYTF
ncbi:porin [Colwelliaceae bacterium BS250]